VLHAVVREHLETFVCEAAARGDGSGVPRFVEEEFRGFLTCGILAHGFARLKCDGCGLEHLLPFLLPMVQGSPQGTRSTRRPQRTHQTRWGA
jgi:hypothetical protein